MVLMVSPRATAAWVVIVARPCSATSAMKLQASVRASLEWTDFVVTSVNTVTSVTLATVVRSATASQTEL